MATAKPKEVKESVFIWEGKDKKGKEVRGEMRAVSDALVRVALRSKGIRDIKLKKQRFSKLGKVKPGDVAVFTRQLATMMKSGVPLLQTFDIVANGHANPAVSKLLYEIKGAVETGTSLSGAFAQHPDYFDNLYFFVEVFFCSGFKKANSRF